MSTQCRKETIDYTYSFIEKVNLSPALKSYKVGDTIWLQYANPDKKLLDNQTKQKILADTISISFQVSFNRRYNAPVNPTGGFCDFVTISGVKVGRYLSANGTGFSMNFGCGGSNNYDFTVGLVLKEKGIYSLDLGTNPQSISSCSNRISGFPFSTIEYRFDIADGNKDIYLSIPPYSRVESPKGDTERRIDDKQVFIVNVE